MILTDVRDYVRARGEVALRDVASHFGMEEEAMRGLLDQWVRRGKLEKLPAGTPCSGCASCAPSSIELYRWIA